MPELPEVETVCRGLRQSVLGSRVQQVELRRPDIRFPIPEELPERMQGAIIARIERRAKYILIYMDNGYVMIGHLGMSGRMMVKTRMPEQLEKHDHVLFCLEDGRVIIYNDPRRFGIITGCEAAALAEHPLIRVLGPEPFSEDFNGEYLYRISRKRQQAVKPFLMEQKTVVGVGNIYASEALFESRIFPERPANKITKKEAVLLVSSIRNVLDLAIQSGGSTLRDYVDSRGEAGYFQHRFLVYGREGAGCAGCGDIIRRVVQAGRATFYCRKCQK